MNPLQAIDPSISSALQPIQDLVASISGFTLGVTATAIKALVGIILVALVVGVGVHVWGAFHEGHSYHGKRIMGRAGFGLVMLLLILPIVFAYVTNKFGVSMPAVTGFTH